MISHKVQADQVTTPSGFKVEIAGGAGGDSTEGGWRSVSQDGLRIHEGEGATFGKDQFKNRTRATCEWGPLTLSGAVTADRTASITWFKEMVEKGKDADCYKDVTITILGPDGSDLYAINFLECFLISYTMGALNADDENEELRETIEICVGYSDNMLNA